MATHRFDASSSVISLRTLVSDAPLAHSSVSELGMEASETTRADLVDLHLDQRSSSNRDIRNDLDAPAEDDRDSISGAQVHAYADGGYGWVVTAGQ